MNKQEYLSPEVFDLALSIQSQINAKKNELVESRTFRDNILDEDEIKFRIGYKLYELRKENGYTLAEVHDLIDISISYISDIENGRTLASIPMLVKLSHFYGINMSSLCELCEL